MPMHRFGCPAGHELEELYRSSEEVPDAVVCPRCGARAPRQVGVVYTVGPVWTGLEDMTKTLLTPAERRAGCEFRSAKEIRRYEEYHGLYRTDAADDKMWREQGLDETSTRRRIVSEDGPEAEAAWVYDQEIKDDTGWDDTKLRAWKQTEDQYADAALQLAESGAAPGFGTDASTIHFDAPPTPD